MGIIGLTLQFSTKLSYIQWLLTQTQSPSGLLHCASQQKSIHFEGQQTEVDFKDWLLSNVLETVCLLFNTLRHTGGLERSLLTDCFIFPNPICQWLLFPILYHTSMLLKELDLANNPGRTSYLTNLMKLSTKYNYSSRSSSHLVRCKNNFA